MKDRETVYAAMEDWAAEGRPMALATIVRVKGSTYRREGAKMLLGPGGAQVGAISGGCLEADLGTVAEEVVASGRPRLLRYDMTADDDAVWGLGLGCNGAIDVLVEPLAGAGLEHQRRLAEAFRAGNRLVACTRLPEQIEPRGNDAGAGAGGGAGAGTRGTAGGAAGGAGGTGSAGPGDRDGLPRLVVREDGSTAGSLGDPALDRAAAGAAQEVLALGESATRDVGGVPVYFECAVPPPRLVVFGAGHDAIPVVRFAKGLGYAVWVVDSRPAYARAERFPEADAVVLARPEEVGGAASPEARVTVTEHDLCLVMTHNYLHDRGLLARLIPARPRYLGMLGPRDRTRQLLQEVEAGGVVVDADARGRLYGPVGLDIGGETPEEIALAALAEMQAVRHGRAGGHLRDRTAPLHARR